MVGPGGRRATIVDVAAAAGVSKTAVSFAFNRPDRLAATTVERIRAAADEIGYRPDPSARLLGRRRSAAASLGAAATTQPARGDRDGTVDTPDWVRDAVFYEIFPDRFARASGSPSRVASSRGTCRRRSTGSRAATCYGIAERLPELAELGITALYLTPIFASAVQPPLPRLRLPGRSTRCSAATPPCASCSTSAHGLGMRVILDGVFNHCGRGFWPFHHVVENGPRRRTATGSISIPEVLAGERPLDPYPDRGGGSLQSSGRSATGPGGACRPCPSSTSTTPPDARVPHGHGRALAALRHRRLAARRPGRDRRPDVLAASSAAAAGRSTRRRLPRRRDLGRGTRLAPRRPLRRAHELPARGGDPRLRRRPGGSTMRSSSSTTRTGGRTRPSTARLRRSPRPPDDGVRPGRHGGPAQPARQPRRAAGPDGPAAATERRSGSPCCSS